MKRKLLSMILLTGSALGSLLLFSSCRHKEPAIPLSGITVSRTYPFRDFQQLKISGLFEINLIPYHKDSLVVSTDSILFQYLSLEQRGNKVSISFDLNDARIVTRNQPRNDSMPEQRPRALASFRNLDLDEMKPVVDIYYLKLENIDAKGAALLKAEKPLKTGRGIQVHRQLDHQPFVGYPSGGCLPIRRELHGTRQSIGRSNRCLADGLVGIYRKSLFGSHRSV